MQTLRPLACFVRQAAAVQPKQGVVDGGQAHVWWPPKWLSLQAPPSSTLRESTVQKKGGHPPVEVAKVMECSLHQFF